MIFIDLEGFNTTTPDLFIIKELAIYSTETKKMELYLFSPPTTFPEDSDVPLYQAKWCTDNLHHLPWDLKGTPYSKLKDIFSSIPNTAVIFAKGLVKIKWLEMQIGRKVHHLSYLEKAKPTDGNIYCLFHRFHPTQHCALHKLTCYLNEMDICNITSPQLDKVVYTY